MQDEAADLPARQLEPIGIFPAIGACVVIMGAFYLGVYIVLGKFFSGAM